MADAEILAREAERDIENARREDLCTERNFWCDVIIESIHDATYPLPQAIERADEALAAYRERFK